jgi:hypothetical protein
MSRRLSVWFFLLISASSALSANENARQAEITDEMEAYRAIQNRPVCTVQDLADLLLMQRGEFSKYPTPAKRLQRARELELIKKEHEGSEELDNGTLAYALMKVYQPEKGWLYWLTGSERYALRDVKEAGILPAKATRSQKLSGERLFAIMTDAEEYITKRSEWEKQE